MCITYSLCSHLYRAFLLAQVAMIGGYRSALKVKQGQVVFDEDQFLKSRPHLEEFLGQLLHFQHFRQFINGRIEKLKNRVPDKDLFDNEVLQYEEGQSMEYWVSGLLVAT